MRLKITMAMQLANSGQKIEENNINNITIAAFEELGHNRGVGAKRMGTACSLLLLLNTTRG